MDTGYRHTGPVLLGSCIAGNGNKVYGDHAAYCKLTYRDKYGTAISFPYTPRTVKPVQGRPYQKKYGLLIKKVKFY